MGTGSIYIRLKSEKVIEVKVAEVVYNFIDKSEIIDRTSKFKSLAFKGF